MTKYCRATDNVTDKLPTLKELDNMNVPRSAIMCGFVVHLPDRDEFLKSNTENDEMDLRTWSRTPENAIRYPNSQSAYDFVRGYDKNEAIVCILFELKKQYLICNLPEKNFA